MVSMKVGIFFIVNQSIILDAAPLNQAKKNNEFIEHGEHYNFWQVFAADSADEHLFKSHAYDYYPRGRVTFSISKQKPSLYLDKCLSKSALERLLSIFELPKELLFKRDEHYQCHFCKPDYLDDYEHGFED